MHANSSSAALETTIEIGWSALLAASQMMSEQGPPAPGGYTLDAKGRLSGRAKRSGALLVWVENAGWVAGPDCEGLTRDLFDLYLPLCNASTTSPITVGHLGQSLDGFIASADGESFYVTGPENIRHSHRMRALCDAIVVGAETVAADNPRLTTRLVPGPHPLRVVLDPQRRLATNHTVFCDAEAPTLVVCKPCQRPNSSPRLPNVEVLEIPLNQGQLALNELLAALWKRGCYRIFIEGGGFTVSRFLEQDLLDRLQIAVAPLVIGSGRPGVQLPGSAFKDCLRPVTRLYRMGGDILFDLNLRADTAPSRSTHDDLERVL